MPPTSETAYSIHLETAGELKHSLLEAMSRGCKCHKNTITSTQPNIFTLTFRSLSGRDRNVKVVLKCWLC